MLHRMLEAINLRKQEATTLFQYVVRWSHSAIHDFAAHQLARSFVQPCWQISLYLASSVAAGAASVLASSADLAAVASVAAAGAAASVVAATGAGVSSALGASVGLDSSAGLGSSAGFGASAGLGSSAGFDASVAGAGAAAAAAAMTRLAYLWRWWGRHLIRQITYRLGRRLLRWSSLQVQWQLEW